MEYRATVEMAQQSFYRLIETDKQKQSGYLAPDDLVSIQADILVPIKRETPYKQK